jgi:hypothetical protein
MMMLVTSYCHNVSVGSQAWTLLTDALFAWAPMLNPLNAPKVVLVDAGSDMRALEALGGNVFDANNHRLLPSMGRNWLDVIQISPQWVGSAYASHALERRWLGMLPGLAARYQAACTYFSRPPSPPPGLAELRQLAGLGSGMAKVRLAGQSGVLGGIVHANHYAALEGFCLRQLPGLAADVQALEQLPFTHEISAAAPSGLAS